MPGFDLAGITSRATARLGNRTDITLSDASFWANEALREVSDSLGHDLREGLAVSSTTSGENKITKPSDFYALTNLSNLSASQGDKRVLLRTSVDQIDSKDTASGAPTKFLEYNNWIELYPMPDSAYSLQLRYEKQLTELVATTDLPSVATRYRPAIMYKTAELLASNVIMSPEIAAAARGDYINHMASQPSDLALRQRSREGMSVQYRRDRF